MRGELILRKSFRGRNIAACYPDSVTGTGDMILKIIMRWKVLTQQIRVILR